MLAREGREFQAPARISKRVREILQTPLPWREASSPQYRDCPHSYIISAWDGERYCRPQWDELARLIELHGVPRIWRGQWYKYLHVDGMIYWIDPPALNRAREENLDNEGYPSSDQAKEGARKRSRKGGRTRVENRK